MTFKALTDAYLTDPEFQRQRIFQKKSNWFSRRFLPVLGGSTLLDKITEDKIEKYLEVRRFKLLLWLVPETGVEPVRAGKPEGF
ncbi:MAG TPA: hypothetical protein PKM72_14460, partial [Nitrospirales bacterium]|nr:hypothetical protein [Nitrospirales bacterium]